MFDLLQAREHAAPTFATPDDLEPFSSRLASIAGTIAKAPIDEFGQPIDPMNDRYAAIFRSAERQQRLVDNVFAHTRATEEAYDKQVAAVLAATGVELENPLRGGYARDARRQIAREVREGGMAPIDATGGVPEYQRRVYDQRLAELRAKHPDLMVPDLAETARTVSREAEQEAREATSGDVNPITSFLVGAAGGMWAGRRDPIFMGSLFLGPVSATGRTVAARIADSAIRQGLFNMGVTALEQPAVQAWRAEIGVRSGLEPAIENIGLSFLFGAIPGAVFRGAGEAFSRGGRIRGEDKPVAAILYKGELYKGPPRQD